jgi:hypothetical protein
MLILGAVELPGRNYEENGILMESTERGNAEHG